MLYWVLRHVAYLVICWMFYVFMQTAVSAACRTRLNKSAHSECCCLHHYYLCWCTVYELKSKQSLTLMTKATRSCDRKYCVCINICWAASDLITALSGADAKTLSLLPLEMLTDCWWAIVGIWYDRRKCVFCFQHIWFLLWLKYNSRTIRNQDKQ